VDGLMLPGLRTREELDRISAAVRLPIMSGSPAEALCDEGYLASRRVRLWSSGHQTLNVAMNALYEAMKKVREGTLSSDLPGAASKQLVDTVTAAADYAAWTKAYLR
jgi:carboxyvinyl-carboxyphosphonate phosphorylmutase